MTRSATEHAFVERLDMREGLITYASVTVMALVRVMGTK